MCTVLAIKILAFKQYISFHIIVFKEIRNHSQTLIMGSDAKRGSQKIFTFVRGKIFSENGVYMIFYVKKRGGEDKISIMIFHLH